MVRKYLDIWKEVLNTDIFTVTIYRIINMFFIVAFVFVLIGYIVLCFKVGAILSLNGYGILGLLILLIGIHLEHIRRLFNNEI